MLVLTRKAGQSIRIGEDVEVCVLRVDNGQAQIGITAPRQVPVHRLEVFLAIHQENDASRRLSPEEADRALRALKDSPPPIDRGHNKR